MSKVTVNNSTFANINWDTFKGRPTIDPSMKFCSEKKWHTDTKCCMSGYTIEHVLDMAYDHGKADSPEVTFLEGYPCLNGRELDSFVDKLTVRKTALGQRCQFILNSAIQRFLPKRIFTKD